MKFYYNSNKKMFILNFVKLVRPQNFPSEDKQISFQISQQKTDFLELEAKSLELF